MHINKPRGNYFIPGINNFRCIIIERSSHGKDLPVPDRNISIEPAIPRSIDDSPVTNKDIAGRNLGENGERQKKAEQEAFHHPKLLNYVKRDC